MRFPDLALLFSQSRVGKTVSHLPECGHKGTRYTVGLPTRSSQRSFRATLASQFYVTATTCGHTMFVQPTATVSSTSSFTVGDPRPPSLPHSCPMLASSHAHIRHIHLPRISMPG